MKSTILALAVAGALMLAGCGGGAKTASMIPEPTPPETPTPPTTPTPPETPTPEPGPYTIGEIYDFETRLINVLTHHETRNRVQIRGENVLSILLEHFKGNVSSPLREYLDRAIRDPATDANSSPILHRLVIRDLINNPAFWNPITTQLNRDLPQDYHVTWEQDTRTFQASSYATIEAYRQAVRAGVPDGALVVSIVLTADRSRWLGSPPPATYLHGPPGQQVLILSTLNTGNAEAALVLLYRALGISVAGSSITQTDRDTLRAVYSFGDWNSRLPIVMGETINGTVFGVTGETDGAVPWAYGRRSQGLLTDAISGSGTVSWEGAVVGLTDDMIKVAGDVELEVDLATAYTGQHDLTFDEMRIWEGVYPSTDDPLWNGDGRLDYKVSLDGSGFRRAGGDEGTINGQFFSTTWNDRNTWNDMGGTLHRTDLTAAFGGSR